MHWLIRPWSCATPLGALIASNNNWATTIMGGIITSNQVHEIQASGYVPGDPTESAIIADLPAGNYTAVVRGVDNMTGVALVEVYKSAIIFAIQKAGPTRCATSRSMRVAQ